MADSNSTTFYKFIAILGVVTLIIFIVGYSTSYWAKTDYVHQGLWRYCLFEVCSESDWSKVFDVFSDDSISWLEAVQAFETLGFIAGLVALILIVLYIFVPATAGKKITFILAMLACFAAAGCIILGIIIYGAKMDNLSWSFALCTIAGIIFGVAGVLLLVDSCKR